MTVEEAIVAVLLIPDLDAGVVIGASSLQAGRALCRTNTYRDEGRAALAADDRVTVRGSRSAAAGVERRVTAHSGRLGLASELTEPGRVDHRSPAAQARDTPRDQSAARKSMPGGAVVPMMSATSTALDRVPYIPRGRGGVVLAMQIFGL